jgi:hypothetical protein
MTTAYPLRWPPGWPRTDPSRRERWPQGDRLTISGSLKSLQDELRRLGATQIVLSSNVSLGNEHPTDVGVVAYALYGKKQIAIPCDRWASVAANLRAIAKTIEAMRGMERWGAKHMITAMFQGFTALAAPDRADWRASLGFRPDERPTPDQVKMRRNELAQRHHPDRGGNPAQMAEINAAHDAALRELAA